MTERTDKESERKLTTLDRDQVVRGLDEVWDSLVMLAAELGPDDWHKSTECPGWSVKDIYAHIIGTEAMLLGRPIPDVDVPRELAHVQNDIGRINEAWVLSSRDRSGAEVVSDLAEVVTERRAALSSQTQFDFGEPGWTPAGHDTHGRFMRIRVMDQWIHEQDVREATGHPGHLEGTAPELVLDEMATLLGYMIGKQAGAPKGSSIRLELTGPVARTFNIEVAQRARVVDALQNGPTAALQLPGTIFFRIAGGRRPWDDPALRSQISLAGDEALAEQVLSNLKVLT